MPQQLFLVIDKFRRRFAQMVVALEPLSSAPSAPVASSCRGYFRADTGVALVQLDYPRLTASELEWTARVCDGAGAAILNPALLDNDDLTRFYVDYLNGYQVCADSEASAEDALMTMGRKLRLVAGGGSPGRRQVGTSADGREVGTRGRHARGSNAEQTVSATPRPVTMPLGSPMSTVKGTPVTGTTRSDDRVEVRYRRGDAWVPGRLRSLNIKSVFVATSAPPRVRDQVRIALSFRDVRAVVEGVVTRVTSEADGGTTGFRTSLAGLDVAPRRQLAALLRAAHAAGVSLVPPPPRAEARLPVRWPIRVTTPAGHRTVSALDISGSGLFLGTERDRLQADLRFLFPMDNGESPIRGRARIARTVDTAMAKVRGLQRGYGVEIVEISSLDERRFGGFLARVRRRTRKTVVVVGKLERSTAIAEALSSVGYAVSTGSDSAVVRQRWERESRQPDAAIIDGSVSYQRAAVELEAMWTARGVACVRTGTDAAPDRTRAHLDRLLRVSRKTSGIGPAVG